MIDYKTEKTNTITGQGLYVAAVSHSNDFRVGDRIIAVNGDEVATCGQVRDILGAFQAGDAVGVTVVREEEQLVFEVTLTEADVPEKAGVPAA